MGKTLSSSTSIYEYIISTVQECWNKAKNNNYYVLYPLLTLPYLTYVRLCKVVFLVKKLIFRGWGVVAKYH